MKYIIALILASIVFCRCTNKERPGKRQLCIDNDLKKFGDDTLIKYFVCDFDRVRIRNGVPVAPNSLKVYRQGYDFIAWGDTLRHISPNFSYCMIIFDRLKKKHVRDFGRIYINDSLDLEYSFGNGRVDTVPEDHFESWTKNIRTGVTTDLSRKGFDSLIRSLPGGDSLLGR